MDTPSKRYSFFQHRECEYFPCHKGVDEAEFNCLFCWCPLYLLGPDCGGAFKIKENGVKDCTACPFPHLRGNYGKIKARYKDILRKLKQG